ncbi:hypothetical protein ABID42_000732 [Arcicella rosea]
MIFYFMLTLPSYGANIQTKETVAVTRKFTTTVSKKFVFTSSI